MQRTRLGCLTGTGLIAALIAVLAIAGFALASGGRMFSPGALNSTIHGQPLDGVTSHADIAGNCKACHVAPWEKQTMDDRCEICHTDVRSKLGDVQSPHGRMYAIDPKAQCRDCHPEHRGAISSLTEIADWKYPHQLSGFSLDAHQFKAEKVPFQCNDCHSSDVTTFEVKYCIACHGQKDAAFTTSHMVAYGQDCVNCHDGKDSLGKQLFTHANFSFKLNGKHSGVECVNCHAAEHSLDEFKATSQECANCHKKDDPHGGTLGNDCGSCHSIDGWKPAHFDHNRSVFKLLPAHVNVPCASCHINKVFKGTPMDCFSCHKQNDPHTGTLGQDCRSCHKPTTWKDITFDHTMAPFQLLGKHSSVDCGSCHKDKLFKSTPVDCAACHKDPHGGQMGNDCAKCHNPSNWKDVHFDHATTGFSLTGNHVGVQCTACHGNNVFKGTPSNCYACHAARDAHGGQFGTDCGSCHNPSGWQNVTFNHNKDTAFQLRDSHTNVACGACHVNNVFKGTPTDCYGCHAARDNHNGQFGTDCGSCHRPTQWSDVTFDHNNTAFPLIGHHTQLSCNKCHGNGVYKGTPTECIACHKDKHNGQNGTDCSICHNPKDWGNVKKP